MGRAIAIVHGKSDLYLTSSHATFTATSSSRQFSRGERQIEVKVELEEQRNSNSLNSVFSHINLQKKFQELEDRTLKVDLYMVAKPVL